MTKEEFAGIFESAGFTPIITEYEYLEEPAPAIHTVNYSINACVDLMFKVSQFILDCSGDGYAADYDPVFKAVHDYFLSHFDNASINDLLYSGMVIQNDGESAHFVPFIKYTDDGYVRVGIIAYITWYIEEG